MSYVDRKYDSLIYHGYTIETWRAGYRIVELDGYPNIVYATFNDAMWQVDKANDILTKQIPLTTAVTIKRKIRP